jgi:ribosome production factor 1
MERASSPAAGAAARGGGARAAPRIAVSGIRNKLKRAEVFQRQRAEVRKVKSEERRKRQREEEAAAAQGVEPPAKQRPRTYESMREADDTMVLPDDVEVAQDEAQDEFAGYFSSEKAPKVLITTRRHPSKHIYPLLRELLMLFPTSQFYNRGSYELGQICKFATRADFTHVLVVGERLKMPRTVLLIHLPLGPTMLFRLSSVVLGYDIEGHGNPTKHNPEIVLNNFATRLGHRVGRMMGSLFPHAPDFRGRQVVTFHNQRDYVFVRNHRYIFRKDSTGKLRARLQEIGPRLTLKLKWIQHGPFDPTFGPYEWYPRHKEVDRKRKFHL